MLLQFVEGYKQKNTKQEQKQKHRCTGTYIQSLDRSQQTILKKSNNDDINTLQCNSDNYKIVSSIASILWGVVQQYVICINQV